jgi:hypothetical protein
LTLPTALSVPADGLDESLKSVQHLHLGLMESVGCVAFEEVGDRIGSLLDVVVDLHQLAARVPTSEAKSATAPWL